MIHISPGHENSISLEIFLKSFKMLPQNSKKHITLHIRKKELAYFFKSYSIDYKFDKNFIIMGSETVKAQYFSSSKSSFAQAGLESALENLDPKNDILVTLPTSKDTLIHQNEIAGGHSEYFRKKYNLPHLTMGFKKGERIFLLLTDHIPLREVPNALTQNLVQTKIHNSLKQIEELFWKPKDIYLSGINPHAGEQKLLGDEEKVFDCLPTCIQGPVSGDTLHLHFKEYPQVFIYAFHDQALALFKGKYGLLGTHITFGLPFPRLSVDHGTAFDLYGKNQANFLGFYHTLLEALRIHQGKYVD